jgi:hypothetical protein
VAVRERLGLSTGYPLELVGGAIVLRPADAAAVIGVDLPKGRTTRA